MTTRRGDYTLLRGDDAVLRGEDTVLRGDDTVLRGDGAAEWKLRYPGLAVETKFKAININNHLFMYVRAHQWSSVTTATRVYRKIEPV